MTEFQFRIEDLRLWAPHEAEILQWPDRVPIYDHNAPTEHGAFLTGHRYVYTLPQDVEEALKRGGGEILPHFEGLPDNVEGGQPPRQRLSYLFFNEFNPASDS
ncbi:MAG: hypothetical protein ACKVRN_03220 [Pyrinomonadaceae bacterium]